MVYADASGVGSEETRGIAAFSAAYSGDEDGEASNSPLATTPTARACGGERCGGSGVSRIGDVQPEGTSGSP